MHECTFLVDAFLSQRYFCFLQFVFPPLCDCCHSATCKGSALFVKLVLTRNADVARVPPHPPKCRRFVLPRPLDAKFNAFRHLSGKFYCIPIASLPPFLPEFYPFLRPFWSQKKVPLVFSPHLTPVRCCRHIDDVDTCFFFFFSFVFASNVLAFPVPLVFSLPHCATFIPLIFLLVNGPPRREDYPTAIINADVCKQTLAGNEECS